MYNTHPPHQHSGGQYICQKRWRAYVIVCCHLKVVWKMALVAGSSTTRRHLAKSLTGTWPWTIAPPRCAISHSLTVTFSHTSPLPVYHGCDHATAGRGVGRGADSAHGVQPVKCCNM